LLPAAPNQCSVWVSNSPASPAPREQVQEEGRLELIDDFVHPDFHHHTVESGQRDDRAGVRETTRAMHEAFSELRVEVLHCDAVSLLRQTGALT
jgi:SnoaL-like polyketide cyclase